MNTPMSNPINAFTPAAKPTAAQVLRSAFSDLYNHFGWVDGGPAPQAAAQLADVLRRGAKTATAPELRAALAAELAPIEAALAAFAQVDPKARIPLALAARLDAAFAARDAAAEAFLLTPARGIREARAACDEREALVREIEREAAAMIDTIRSARTATMQRRLDAFARAESLTAELRNAAKGPPHTAMHLALHHGATLDRATLDLCALFEEQTGKAASLYAARRARHEEGLPAPQAARSSGAVAAVAAPQPSHPAMRSYAVDPMAIPEFGA